MPRVTINASMTGAADAVQLHDSRPVPGGSRQRGGYPRRYRRRVPARLPGGGPGAPGPFWDNCGTSSGRSPGPGSGKAFHGWAKSTNGLRDLDVYLLEQAGYRRMLTGAPGGGRDAAVRVCRAGAGSRHGARWWRSWLPPTMTARCSGGAHASRTKPALGVGPRGSEPILSLAGARVAKKCRAVLEQGFRLRGKNGSRGLHSLRIECKQLRYLMEILADLTPEAGSVVQRTEEAPGRPGQDPGSHGARSPDPGLRPGHVGCRGRPGRCLR